MRRLIPFEFADLGVVEFAWLLLVFGGLSLLSPSTRRVRAAVWIGVVMLLFGVLRWFQFEGRGGAWVVWIGPVFVSPVMGAGVMLLGELKPRLPAGTGRVWLALLLLVGLIGRPFGLSPLDHFAEWIFLALAGLAVAAIVQGVGPLRAALTRPIAGRVRLWALLAVLFMLDCILFAPFGLTWVAGLALLFVAWLAYAVQAQGREMRSYVARRLLGAPVVLVILLTLSFFLMRSAPGGPLLKEKSVDPAIRELIAAKYGFDKPLITQFFIYIRTLIWDGDLGPSFKLKGFGVNEIIATQGPQSARLGLAAICLAVLVGVTAGLVSGIRQNSIFDYTSMTVAMLGLALPTFIVGPMLVLVFAMKLDWFAVTGWETFPRDLVLPAITLALPFAARIARLTRAGMLEIVNQDYIRTARAKGLSEPTIVLRHTLKGTLLPVVSFLGPGIAQMLTGSLVVEVIFRVPGLGQEFVNSAVNRDYGVAMGLVLVYGTLLIVFNLVVDIAYAFLDPRIRHA